MNGDPFFSFNSTLNSNGSKRSRNAATKCGSSDARDTFRQRHDVAIGVSHCDVIGKPSPTIEAGLILSITDVLIAALALDASAASSNEGYRYPFANEIA